MKKIAIVMVLLLISRVSFSQFYLEVNSGYAMPYKLNKNNFSIVNKQTNYNYFENIDEQYVDTVKFNFAEGMYYGANIGYNFYKYFGVSIGYNTMSSNNNPVKINSKKHTYVTEITNYAIFFAFGDDFMTTDTAFYYEKESYLSNYFYKINTYKLSLQGKYSYKSLDLFGEINFRYTKIFFTKYTNKDEAYIRYGLVEEDSLGNQYVNHNTYCYRHSLSKYDYQYVFKNAVDISYALGLRYNFNSKISFSVKATYNKNYYLPISYTKNTVIYKESRKNEEPFKYYTQTQPQETTLTSTNYFFPTIRFDIGLRYTFDNLKF